MPYIMVFAVSCSELKITCSGISNDGSHSWNSPFCWAEVRQYYPSFHLFKAKSLLQYNLWLTCLNTEWCDRRRPSPCPEEGHEFGISISAQFLCFAAEFTFSGHQRTRMTFFPFPFDIYRSLLTGITGNRGSRARYNPGSITSDGPRVIVPRKALHPLFSHLDSSNIFIAPTFVVMSECY